MVKKLTQGVAGSVNLVAWIGTAEGTTLPLALLVHAVSTFCNTWLSPERSNEVDNRLLSRLLESVA